jgi:hypothetical protein
MMEDVDSRSTTGLVLLSSDADCVALAAETPVTMTAVPVAATPPTRPFVVLLA